MYIINGYQSKGKITDTGLEYDNIVLSTFADEWETSVSMDTTYFHFGQPTLDVKLPTALFIDALGLKFNAGEDTKSILKRNQQMIDNLSGAEITPLYNHKGKVVKLSIDLPTGAVNVPADEVVIEPSKKSDTKKG